MGRAVQIPVRARVLRWARETSGATIDEAAKHAGVPHAVFAGWENSGTALTLTQARGLATYFKRPLAAFFLQEPPVEAPLPRDFRTLPHPKDRFERATRLAIRKARRLQSVARDLLQSLDREISPLLKRTDIADDPATVANRERERMAVSVQRQEEWQNEWEAFREWRSAIERQNVLTFQFPIPVEDVRGFSFGDQEPYVVAVSSSDAVRARIFTLFHEYGHLLLHNAGICTPAFEARNRRPELEVEQWCNRFAGELLIPKAALGFLPTNLHRLGGRALADALTEGSRKFKVSESVLLFRLFHNGLVSRQALRSTLQEIESRTKRSKTKVGPVRPARRSLAENGVTFSALVLEARNRGLINYADVGDFLGIRLKHLPEIESSLLARAA